jgi:hypothetical protein
VSVKSKGYKLYCYPCSVLVNRKNTAKIHKKTGTEYRRKNSDKINAYYRKKYAENPEKGRQICREYYLKVRSNPGFMENKSEQFKLWRCDNPLKYKKLLERTAAKNYIAYHTNWLQREQKIYEKRKRIAEKNFAKICFTFEEWLNKKISVDGICEWCGKDVGFLRLTMDHDFSINEAKKEYLKTGKMHEYVISEINPLCFKCNCRKRTKALCEVMVIS